MTDFANLTTANELNNQLQTILFALDALDAGGLITGSVESGGYSVRLLGVADYPPQMVQGIREQLETRRDAMIQQLRDLGVTGDPVKMTPAPNLSQLALGQPTSQSMIEDIVQAFWMFYQTRFTRAFSLVPAPVEPLPAPVPEPAEPQTAKKE